MIQRSMIDSMTVDALLILLYNIIRLLLLYMSIIRHD